MLHEYIAEGVDFFNKCITIVLLVAILYRLDMFFKTVEQRKKFCMLVNVAVESSFAQLLFELGEQVLSSI
jgi:hypothetical protein